ncbi:MAG: TonB-dependent receptor [Woeseiaceae bacterium]|nr:TonB-dependent receptor [Woeseiaceae bacterium]
MQLNTASSNWAFFTAANGDTARTAGLELELDGLIGNQWHYNVGYAYVDGELTGDAFAPTASMGLLAADGSPLPGTSEHTLNAALDYTTELGNGMTWMSRINGYYQSETQNSLGDFGRAPGTFMRELDGFALWNFVTTVSKDNWDASLFVKNLTDEEGITGLFTEQYMGTSPAQNYIGNGNKEFIAQPRTIRVECHLALLRSGPRHCVIASPKGVATS